MLVTIGAQRVKAIMRDFVMLPIVCHFFPLWQFQEIQIFAISLKKVKDEATSFRFVASHLVIKPPA